MSPEKAPEPRHLSTSAHLISTWPAPGWNGDGLLAGLLARLAMMKYLHCTSKFQVEQIAAQQPSRAFHSFHLSKVPKAKMLLRNLEGSPFRSPSISPENVSWFLSIPASLPSRIPTFAILASKAQSLALDLRWKIFQHHCPWLGYFYRSQTQQVDGKNGLFQLSCIHLSFLLATWCRREPSSRCSCHVRSARYNAPDAHSPLSIIPNAKNL